ncbi:transposase [Acidisarcina polymorpha]|uniref:transposase n=1 Tax=Acidisarcina polymorpha TaxID=2211140 RepID=UPI0013749BDB|nr:transposase [Acidisarcina polymorpha]
MKLRREALTLIAADAHLSQRFRLLTSVPGIAAVSALQILGELVLLAPDMKVRQWVARSGLDPVHQDSGTSVHKTIAHQSRWQSPPAPGALYAGSGRSALGPTSKGVL